jgi:phage repressor protein C with HTH and peptisase S24 domain
MGAIHRLKEYLDFKGINNSSFEKSISLSNGYIGTQLKRNATLGEEVMNKILDNCLDVSPDWLLTGKGEMLRGEVEPGGVNVFNSTKDRVIDASQDIPLYDLEASAGIVSLFSDSHDNPIDHIRIPGIPKCDGALKVSGDSMYPLLKSGDIVMYKQMHEFVTGIYVFGEMYIIGFELHGDVFVVVKYIHKSEKDNDHIKLVSQNQHHDDFEIPKTSIRALAIVKASIRINSMK